jgi:hypothetical protein
MRIPLDLDDNASCFHQAGMLSIDHCCLVKTYNLLPHKPLCDNSSSHVYYHQMYGKIQAYDIFEMPILNLHFSTLMDLPLDVILSCAI